MRLLAWLVSSLIFVVVVVGVAGVAALSYFSRDLPDYTQLADYEPPVTTRLYAADGRLLAQYAIENRAFVPVGAIPEHVIQAFISAEDKSFYRHDGIDYRGIIRAAITNLRSLGSDRRLVGASTITQQVAKNFLLSNEVSFERKIREALLALRIERTYSKDRILELYLNQIYLGRNSFGVAAAALNYFNKSLPELTLAEAAYLAGLPKAPNNYHPTREPEAAVTRRNYVIDRMLQDGAITAADAAAARAAPLEVYERSTTEVVDASYFAEEVRREIQQIFGGEALYGGGLTVRTTIDPALQDIADRTLRQGLINYDRRHGWRGPIARLESFDDWPTQLAAIEAPSGSEDWQLATVLELEDGRALIGLADRQRGHIPMAELEWARPWRPNQRLGPAPRRAEDVLALGDVVLVERLSAPAAPVAYDEGAAVYGLRQIPEVEGALIAVDPHTGRVLAMRGGFSYGSSEFNRATQAVRQPGSAFKPFVYLTALALDRQPRFTPVTLINDAPLEIDLGPGAGRYRPSNYSRDFLGWTPLRVGVEKSRNIMTVRLLQEIGLEPVRDMARRFGVYEQMPLFYSMALGAGETTPLRLTAGYAMLANGGREITPTFIDRIQDRRGRTIYRHDVRECPGCDNVAWDGGATPELPDDRQQIVDRVSAFQMVSIMEGVVQRGTATRLRALGVPLAGKTGTTNESRDTWFVGFTPDLAVGVYVGFDNPRTLGPRETGSSVAAPIFGAFMQEALDGIEVPPFRIPPGVRLVRVNPRTGLLAQPGERPAIWEAFRPGTEPTPDAVAQQPVGQPATPGAFPNARNDRQPGTFTGTGGLY